MIDMLKPKRQPPKQLTKVTTIDYCISGGNSDTLLKVSSLGYVGYVVFSVREGCVSSSTINADDDASALGAFQG